MPSRVVLALPVALAVAAAGVLLLVGMVMGVVKWRQMLTSPIHQAHPYVDIAHRAALMYAFASLVLAALVVPGWLPLRVAVAAVVGPEIFFAAAVATYIRLGVAARTENQFTRRGFTTTTGMLLLSAAEIGGTVVALAGFVASVAGR